MTIIRLTVKKQKDFKNYHFSAKIIANKIERNIFMDIIQKLDKYGNFINLKSELYSLIRSMKQKDEMSFFYFFENANQLLNQHAAPLIQLYGFDEVFKEVTFSLFKDAFYERICIEAQKHMDEYKALGDPYFYNTLSSYLNQWKEDLEGNLVYSEQFINDRYNYIYKTGICIKYNLEKNTIHFEKSIKCKPYYISLHEYSDDTDDWRITEFSKKLVAKAIEKKEEVVTHFVFSDNKTLEKFLDNNLLDNIVSEIFFLKNQKFTINELSRIKIDHATQFNSFLIDEIVKNPEQYISECLKDEEEQKVYIEYFPDFYNRCFATDWNEWANQQDISYISSDNHMEYVLIKIEPPFLKNSDNRQKMYYLHSEDNTLTLINQYDNIVATIKVKQDTATLCHTILNAISKDLISLLIKKIKKISSQISSDINVTFEGIEEMQSLNILNNIYPASFLLNDVVIHKEVVSLEGDTKPFLANLEVSVIQHKNLSVEKASVKVKKRI